MLTATTPKYRGRFAPSPTGDLHFGSLVAAMASFLQAKVNNGVWLVRMEDLDPPREVKGAAGRILSTLDKLGMHWDEEVMFQSRRFRLYQDIIDELLNDRLAYFCQCTRKTLASNAPINALGAIYPGTCREKHLPANHRFAVRLRTDNTPIIFRDHIQGLQISHLEKDGGDFVLRRADGYFAYQLAVVADDAEQGITEIVRGADLLELTARQLYLQQLRRYTTPHYAHVPIATNAQHEKLSKQTGATPIDMRYPAFELVAAAQFLGQTPPPGLEHAGINTFWQWALGTWDLSKVPKRKQEIYDCARQRVNFMHN